MKPIERIIFGLLAGMLLLPQACIEPYVPGIEAGETTKFVVSGALISERDEQEVSISLVSSINDPQYIPMHECRVRITDKAGNIFSGTEDSGGRYRIRVPRASMIPGMEYRLEVRTPAGLEIASDYEPLQKCPEIDSLYFTIESIPTRDPEVNIEGIRFYLDLEAGDLENTFFKYELEETWEYEASYPIEWYYDGEVHQVSPPDFSHFICWNSRMVPDIFVLNTGELSKNAFRGYPLHFIDQSDIRISKLYSILVKQYTISRQTYVYWDQLRLNNLEEKGLYESQPLPVRGNLQCITDPEKIVLGNFDVASVSTKRIFVDEIPGLDITYQSTCQLYVLRKGLVELTPDVYHYPVYMPNGGGFNILTDDCVLCEEKGGHTRKPEFWP